MISTGVPGALASFQISRIVFPGVTPLTSAAFPSPFEREPPAFRSRTFFGPNHASRALPVAHSSKHFSGAAFTDFVAQMV
ncbi:MAG: hypothetical protein IPF66_17915 [Holophagales bacterium]|nr:hypothetical protein [Holophagales bacterium]